MRLIDNKPAHALAATNSRTRPELNNSGADTPALMKEPAGVATARLTVDAAASLKRRTNAIATSPVSVPPWQTGPII